MEAEPPPGPSTVQEGYVDVRHARLYYRETGRGQPVILLHGGPDFNHRYLLPELDSLSTACRLIYYDQRGRGKSAAGVQAGEVSLASEVEDLDSLRAHFKLDFTAVLGHSWGGLLALEYALYRPERVSHLILLNPAPASAADYQLLRQGLAGLRTPGELEALAALASSARYASGDLSADAEYYRLHFRPAIRLPALLEELVSRLRIDFTARTVRLARAIEDRLREETWLSGGYDLLPSLARLHVPTLVIHGEHDFIPLPCAEHVARAIPGARLVVLENTGHFPFLESRAAVCREISRFLQETGGG